jgi:methionyl-tRNA formyltransferase
MANHDQPLNKLRTVFFGTPEFGAIVLGRLIEAGYRPVLVVTQPDRPVGRSGTPQLPPVKRVALQHGLQVFQPATLKSPDAVEHIRSSAPDIIVLAAFGLIVPVEILKIPPFGCLNVHPSLLPRHRGPTPIQTAIAQGDEVTGVTIMLMDEGIDTGPILRQASLPISPTDTCESLTKKLADLGARLLIETLPLWYRGLIVPQPQDNSMATKTGRLRKEDGLIDWKRPAVEIERMVRAYYPWPSAYCYWGGRLLKVLQAAVVEEPYPGAPPGTVVVHDGYPAVTTGRGLLVLLKVQLEGKRPTDGRDFLIGHPDLAGTRLTDKEL